jgi:hypothetical protein
LNLTLDYLKGSRKWLVPNLSVWGNSATYQMPMALTEEGVSKRLIFCLAELGGEDQLVKYSDLVDSLGNHLPSNIANPAIILIPRSDALCYLVGRPSNAGFKIACNQTSNQPIVDLLIVEVDLP